MSEKPEKLKWGMLFKPGVVHQDLRRIIIDYQKSEILNKILPDIFHKLKNKLTPIMGYSQLLSLKMTDQGILNKLQRIEKNAEELSHLLDRLREYFKNGMSVPARVNINDVIAGLDPFFSEIEKKHQIEVETDLDKRIPESNLVYGQIEMLVMNVVDNAIQAIKNRNNRMGSGHIRVSTARKGKELKLVIKDNGMGMDPETLSKIWLPFFSQFPSGTGIGLLVCERILADHNGRFQVRSVKDEGTEFEFYFEL